MSRLRNQLGSNHCYQLWRLRRMDLHHGRHK